jgi:hypothetical protein
MGGCAASAPGTGDVSAVSPSLLAQALATTRPLGLGPRFRPAALGNRLAAAGARIGRWSCTRQVTTDYGAHIELFAQDRGMLVPAGIGIATPQLHRGAFVLDGRCRYPLHTTDPTGVVRVSRTGDGPAPTVGQLFRLWGQPLGRDRLASFRGRVVAFVGGRRWTGDPRTIPLARHAQIVLELGPAVKPHPSYLFPSGL